MLPVKCTSGLLKITNIDEQIWSRHYFARCMECHFCNDSCCSYGCPVDILEVERILLLRESIEKRTGIASSGWFFPEPDVRPEFPSGKVLRTRVYNNKCVFHNNQARGCHLHSLALETGRDPHLLKPMVCFLFPLTWDTSYLYVSEFLDELPCKNWGFPVYESQKDEIKTYLGTAFVNQMEGLQLEIKYPSKESRE